MKVTTLFNYCTLYWLSTSVALAEIVSDGTLGAAHKLSLSNETQAYAITQDLGKTVGNHLFHSFQTFNLAQGETAVFSGAAHVENVISRVTGGSPSNINGMIKNSIPGANTYLLNPSGIFFGEHASLDMSGSFHASTANYLQMEDGARFYTDLQTNSSLSISPTDKFGFLGTNSAPIEIRGGGDLGSIRLSKEESLQYRRGYIPQLAVNSGKALSLIAGDIVLTQGGYHQAEIYELETKTVQQVVDFLPVPILAVSGGELNLITQQGTGEIILGNDAPSHVQPSGSFTLERAWLNVSGTPSSKIRLQTDKLLMSNGHIFAENRGVSPAGMIDIWAGDIQLDSSSITASTLSASGAPIHISAENLAIAKGISLSSTTIGEGKGGDIEIELEKEMRLSHSASFLTANFATGKAGNIHVQAQNIKVLDGGFISSSSIMGSGSGGTIQLQASDTVYLESEQYMGQASLSSMSIGDSIEAGTGGDIHVRARHIELVAGAGINTSTFGAGHGGNIQLQADSVRLTGKSQDAQAFPSYLSASSHSFFDDVPAGNAGRIHVQANKLSLEIGTNISTSASQATGGNIQLDINQQLYLHKSEINTSVFGGSGDGGNINIQQPRVAALNQGQIKAQADVGNGGNISIAADHFLSSQNSQINASSRLGIDGQVLIDTPDSYGSSSLLLTAGYFLQTTDLLPLDCAIHNDVLSRFGIKKAPHGTPTAPEDFIY